LPHATSDVVIIGGGVIGTSIAYYLARRKIAVTLLEKGDLAAGSSGACDGLVLLQSKRPGIHLRLALESQKHYQALPDRLPFPIEYRGCGGLVVIESEAEFSAMRRYIKEQREIGLDVRLLDAAAARELEPALAESITGATFSPTDAQVNPLALTHGFALGARQLGASLLTHTAVTGIQAEGKQTWRVTTTRGRLSAGCVVNAAGVHAPRIGEMVKLTIPIQPRRGQILVTEPTPPLIRHCMISARYIAAKYDPELAKSGGEGISLEQTESGNLLLGSTREFVGFDRRNTLEGLQVIARKTAHILPRLAQLKIIRAFAGLRPYTPDGLPIMGAAPGLQGFYVAAGHEGDGIALSPVTGALMAQLIVEGETDLPIDAFRLDRFDLDIA
jgi:sarcosine oxidase subunit beta